MSLLQAPKGRDAARELLAQGVGPRADHQESKRKAAVQANDLFETVARTWHKAMGSERWAIRMANIRG